MQFTFRETRTLQESKESRYPDTVRWLAVSFPPRLPIIYCGFRGGGCHLSRFWMHRRNPVDWSWGSHTEYTCRGQQRSRTSPVNLCAVTFGLRLIAALQVCCTPHKFVILLLRRPAVELGSFALQQFQVRHVSVKVPYFTIRSILSESRFTSF